jgi:hypothetical protein
VSARISDPGGFPMSGKNADSFFPMFFQKKCTGFLFSDIIQELIIFKGVCMRWMWVPVLFVFLGIWGCQNNSASLPAMRINNVPFTLAELEEAYQRSPYFEEKAPSARSDFIDHYLSTKLILLAAEEQGLDKDPQFLKGVEFFWQQSLLKMMLKRKTKELSQNQTLTDQEVLAYYQSVKDKYFKDKKIDEVKLTIRAILLRQKQQKAIEAWIEELKQKADIQIDKKQLGLE